MPVTASRAGGNPTGKRDLSRREPGFGRWLRKRHQDHRHRDPADFAVEIEQNAASGSEPGSCHRGEDLGTAPGVGAAEQRHVGPACSGVLCRGCAEAERGALGGGVCIIDQRAAGGCKRDFLRSARARARPSEQLVGGGDGENLARREARPGRAGVEKGTRIDQERPSADLLSLKDGRRMALPFNSASDSDSQMLGHLRGWERVYDNGGTVLYTKTETGTGLAGATVEWRDVYLKKGDQDPVNLSNCNGTNCGQPSLASNAREVVYIKSDK